MTGAEKSTRSAVHLVGSVGLANEEDVFRALADALGTRAKRYPDGETGKRHYWIRWQERVFAENAGLELAEQKDGYRKDTPLRYFQCRSGIAPSQVTFGSLGYADAAAKSYKTFAKLKQDGVIAPEIRFLVALPTPVAVITSFVVPEERQAIEPSYERALVRELDEILRTIPNDQLAVQWDVCHEILAEDGAFPLHYTDVLPNTLTRLARLSARVPEAADLGVHLCYGDPGHKHIQEPADTGTAVAFANGISQAVTRRVDWIHLPVPRERNDEAYFAPLKNLRLKAGTQLFLGLVHYHDGVQGTLKRIRTAKPIVPDFGIATECGFGRRDPATIPELLRIHAEVADAISAGT